MRAQPSTGFDRIASFYDFLARVIYGQSIVRAQCSFLKHIPESCEVIIVGGGTGWLLAEVLRIRPGCSVCYVESSGRMISIARKRIKNDARVRFIHGTLDDVANGKFDVVVTHFFLDLFSPGTLRKVVKKIRATVSDPALWLVADFVRGGRWWQDLLLRSMYVFFRTICRIESRSLPPWEQILSESGTSILESRYFYAGFIKSVAYRVRAVHFLSGDAPN